MAMTMSEKILARASAKDKVEAGEIVMANIDIAMVDDVYSKILEYDMCNAQREAVLESGTSLNDSNGTVIFAPTRDKTTLVVMSKKVLPQKDLDEVHGTILHELTHAHDYYDYADFLQIAD